MTLQDDIDAVIQYRNTVEPTLRTATLASIDQVIAAAIDHKNLIEPAAPPAPIHPLPTDVWTLIRLNGTYEDAPEGSSIIPQGSVLYLGEFEPVNEGAPTWFWGGTAQDTVLVQVSADMADGYAVLAKNFAPESGELLPTPTAKPKPTPRKRPAKLDDSDTAL